MGKKTNWTSTEDSTLCRVWLNVNDQKASEFWNVVRDIFHQEVDTAVERPLTGLKVRWSRINRESQKFAAIFNEIQSKGIKQAEENKVPGDAATVALLSEQQWVDDAKTVFQQLYDTKFPFETCWRQLRYANKWLQLFTNSTNTPAGMMEESPAAAAPSPASTCGEDGMAPTSSEMSISTGARTSSVAAVAAVAVASQASTSVSDIRCKRRADDHTTNEQLQQQFGLTAALVEELKRQNDLMEDQNTIALLKVDPELPDAEARQCYQLLRARYMKKARRKHGRDYSSDQLV
ncbi:Glutathione S-transferase T3 [Phytophthora citrophthora]|uniref:Glutathione S-transferase T3 n=1 Tax=Phytophthora citrophthora TaxID=4793 RepID=A0AAD9GJF3_9STRA|nr:Glutathione S-transferase T3 [Phytophthora citrophthora]